MCNLYSHTTNLQAILNLFKITKVHSSAGNLPPQPGIYPDYSAPVIRHDADGVRELTMMRWGMPSSSQALFKAASSRADKLRAKGKDFDFKELLRVEPDGGTTNVRNTKSKHWTRWLEPASRCLVPFTSFSEFNKEAGGNIWFVHGDDRPTASFAGIFATNWTSTRKVKFGVVRGQHNRRDSVARRRYVIRQCSGAAIAIKRGLETLGLTPWRGRYFSRTERDRRLNLSKYPADEKPSGTPPTLSFGKDARWTAWRAPAMRGKYRANTWFGL